MTQINFEELKKAIYPALVALFALLVQGFGSGEWNNVELALATVGVVHVVLAFFTTNVPAWSKLKAYVPLFVNFIGIGALWAATGTLNREEFAAAGLAIILAVITGVTPNGGTTVKGLGSYPVSMSGAPLKVTNR